MKIDNVLLGLIKIHPQINGYQLKTIINKSTGYFFQAHLSQIYPRLKRMTADGLLEFETAPQAGKPDQKFYSITDKGIESLDIWLKKPFPFVLQRSCFDDYLLKLLFMGHLEKEDIVAYLDDGIEYFTKELELIRNNDLKNEIRFAQEATQASAESYVELWGGVMGYLYDEHTTRIDWLKRMRTQYQ